jgi:hypothetical protein
MPHRKYSYVIGARNVVDVISSSFEQDATRPWYGGLSIQTADVWSVADDVERRGQFIDE